MECDELAEWYVHVYSNCLLTLHFVEFEAIFAYSDLCPLSTSKEEPECRSHLSSDLFQHFVIRLIFHVHRHRSRILNPVLDFVGMRCFGSKFCAQIRCGPFLQRGNGVVPVGAGQIN
jgi:hypothetical protein